MGAWAATPGWGLGLRHYNDNFLGALIYIKMPAQDFAVGVRFNEENFGKLVLQVAED